MTCVKWGGDGLLYTSSQDRTVKVWRAKDVSVCVKYMVLKGYKSDMVWVFVFCFFVFFINMLNNIGVYSCA